MCEATTLTIASMAVGALSTGVQMYAQNQQQQAQADAASAAAEYNAQVAANEAATREQLARNEMSKGIADRERQQRQAARAMGEMRANMGASGFEMDSGTMESLLAESAQEHQYDSQVIMNNAAQAAWQQQVAQTGALNQMEYANWQKSNADSGRGATGLAMAGTLLGGIAGGIGTYNTYLKNQPATKPGDTFRLNAGKSQYTQYGF
ncbi:MAG: hypothetical protein LBR94_01230 [Desulfovibrio sp.]|jgi:hypothetical protein|nr:hypothetical protein [Desulfovibrio sp.]